MKDPVCPLILSLYGHPDAGGYWERHCERHLKSVGFEPIQDWRSCFWHPQLKLMLVVYVDDFKLAGPKGNLTQGWKLIRQGVRTEEPTPAGKYLGCEHIIGEVRISKGESPLAKCERGGPSALATAEDRLCAP